MSSGGSVPWKIGMRRILKIMDEERSKGNKAFYTGLYSNLPDVVIVFEDSRIIRVYEVTNFANKDEYIRIDRAIRYRDTLNEFPRLERILVVSYEENLRYIPREFFSRNGIIVKVVGYQD